MRVRAEAPPMRAGVIVAGGRSMRFGDRDKVLADLAGVPMIRRTTERLVGVTDELVVNCRADQLDGIKMALSGIDVRLATDSEPDRGPVAGIHAGLTAVETEYSVVVAADMPLVSPRFVSYLFDRAAGHDAAIPRFDGQLQPTQAVYRTGPMADACAAALERDDRRLMAVLSDLDYAVVNGDEVCEHTDTFTNLNTREEFEQVGSELAAAEATGGLMDAETEQQ